MTTLLTPQVDTDIDDGPAIAELHRPHSVQRKAFLADPYPDAYMRKGHVGALAGMVLAHRDEIRVGMVADFGAHPDLFTDLMAQAIVDSMFTGATAGDANPPVPD